MAFCLRKSLRAAKCLTLSALDIASHQKHKTQLTNRVKTAAPVLCSSGGVVTEYARILPEAAQSERSVNDQAAGEGSANEANMPKDPEALHQPNDIDSMLQDQDDAESVLKVVQERGKHFTDCNCVSAFRQLAKVCDGWDKQHLQEKVHKHPQFVELVNMVMGAAATFNAAEYTALIQAAGRLHFEDQDLLDDLSRQLIELIGDMGQTQLLQLVQGLALADHSPGAVLFDAVRAQIKVLGDHVDAHQHEQLKQAFDKFGYEYQ